MSGDQPMDMGKWKGLFEWSMKYQDGAQGSADGPKQLDPDKKAWLETALQEFMKDFADRMKEINSSLRDNQQQAAGSTPEAGGSNSSTAAVSSSQGASLSEKEALCDELMEIVENVDYARDLHKIGGLSTLLSLMSSPHPSLRWRAAEITATCMANNPPVQRWFMEGGALPPLLALLSDPHPVVVTKALLGLSALVRHYDPGLEAFRLAGGLNKLLALLGCNTDIHVHPTPAADPAAAAASQQQQDDDQPTDQQQQQQQQQRRLQRKVLALLQYVLAKHPADGFASAEFGAVAQLQRLIVSDPDSDMRTASLSVLAEIVSNPRAWEWVKQHEQGLQQQLQQLEHQQVAAAAAGGVQEEEDAEERVLLHDVVQVLQASGPPQGKLQGLVDHIELDPYQDGRERAEPKTMHIKDAAGQTQQQEQEQQQQQQGSGGAMSLLPPPPPPQ